MTNPDKAHFDGMLLKEIAWKLDREVWAHVPNPDPSEQWTTSKARERTRELICEYIGNYDSQKEIIIDLLKAVKQTVSYLKLGDMHEGERMLLYQCEAAIKKAEKSNEETYPRRQA